MSACSLASDMCFYDRITLSSIALGLKLGQKFLSAQSVLAPLSDRGGLRFAAQVAAAWAVSVQGLS